MSATFSRTDTSLLGTWWWTVDRWMLLAVLVLASAGLLFVFAASPAIADRLGIAPLHFVKRQMMFLPTALLLMTGLSMISSTGVRRLGLALFGGAFLLTMLTLLVGAEIKGATRWLHLPGFSLQPSEFLKPGFAVLTAWLLTRTDAHGQPLTHMKRVSTVTYALVCGVLLLQPDVGMSIVISAIWAAQLTVAGAPLVLIAALGLLGVVGLVAAYALFPHVQSRVDRFLDPNSGDTYQVRKSLEAFSDGGLWGRGPGEGSVKAVLPDAHTDFIFAVVGEEFGIAVCLGLVALFAFIVLRGLSRVQTTAQPFAMLAVVGLLTGFGLQALINMASSLSLIPTKGMTLPFVSYGGSSLLALAVSMGFVLALTRRCTGQEAPL